MEAFRMVIYSEPVPMKIPWVLFVDQLKKHDMSMIIGAAYMFTPKWGVSLRYTRSLFKMLSNKDFEQGGLLGYFVTLRGEYHFKICKEITFLLLLIATVICLILASCKQGEQVQNNGVAEKAALQALPKRNDRQNVRRGRLH